MKPSIERSDRPSFEIADDFLITLIHLGIDIEHSIMPSEDRLFSWKDVKRYAKKLDSLKLER